MDTRFKIVVAHQIGSDGLPTYMVTGTDLDVNGKPYVHQPWGTIVPDQGFAASKAEARLAAAMEIEGLGRRLLDQAEQLRAQAAKEVDDGTP